MVNRIKALILLSLGAFVGYKYVSGQFYNYISEEFVWLLPLGAGLLFILALSYIGRDDEHHHDHDHDHAHESRWSTVLSLALIAFPVIIGVTIPARPLGASAVENRGVSLKTTDALLLGNAPSDLEVNQEAKTSIRSGPLSSRAAAPSQERITVARNVLDWTRAFAFADDPSVFYGQEANVLGFVYREPWLTNDQFLVTRFVITCCVADAVPMGMVVQMPGASDYPYDSWVQVRGTLAEGNVNGEIVPVIVAEEITPAEEPTQPYIPSGANY